MIDSWAVISFGQEPWWMDHGSSPSMLMWKFWLCILTHFRMTPGFLSADKRVVTQLHYFFSFTETGACWFLLSFFRKEKLLSYQQLSCYSMWKKSELSRVLSGGWPQWCFSVTPEGKSLTIDLILVRIGMGVPTVTAARILKGQLNGQSGEETQLEMDKFPFVSLAKVCHFLLHPSVWDHASILPLKAQILNKVV